MFQSQEVDSDKMTNLEQLFKPFALSVAAMLMTATLSHPHPANAEERALSFAVSGVVDEVLVKAGDEVKAGQALARLDVRPFEADLMAAGAGLKAAQKAAWIAADNLVRTQELYDDVSASGENLEDAQIAAVTAASELARIKAGHQMAGWRLERATLLAPVNAKVSAVPGYAGMVTSAEGTNPSVVVLDFP